MLPTRQGSFRLFQLSGIAVYLHWSWFLLAYYVFSVRGHQYASAGWNMLEFLSLFGIVLMHEFGHSLACRQVGGRAEQIVLWPFGGVAYVMPPQRPGAVLWSIAAGPLVNVILVPVTVAVLFAARQTGITESNADIERFLLTLTQVNIVLLIFNMLPIYPMDGGQILRALLWFVLGRGRSLLIASGIGLLIGATVIGWILFSRIWMRSTSILWIGLLVVFVVLNCWQGFMYALTLMRNEKLPRRTDARCPVCNYSPPLGPFWLCGQCRKPFDIFQHRGACPACGQHQPATLCPECATISPVEAWDKAPGLPPKYH